MPKRWCFTSGCLAVNENPLLTDEQRKSLARLAALLQECFNARDAAEYARSRGRYAAAQDLEAEADELQEQALALVFPESRG